MQDATRESRFHRNSDEQHQALSTSNYVLYGGHTLPQHRLFSRKKQNLEAVSIAIVMSSTKRCPPAITSSVDRINSVVDATTSSVRLNDVDIFVAVDSLFLVVSSQSIRHGVGERVLRMSIKLSRDNSLSDGAGSGVGGTYKEASKDDILMKEDRKLTQVGLGGVGRGSVGRGGVAVCGGSVCGASVGGGSIGEGSSHLGDGGSISSGGSNDSLGNGGAILVHNSVESVDGISGVLDGTTGAIGLSQRVRSLDNISVAGLVLVLAVSGQSILDVVGVRVLRVGVEVGVDSDGSLSNGGGISSHSGGSIGSTSVGRGGVCAVSGSSGVGSHGRGADDSSASHSNAGGESDQL
ncbi:hypothetical protein B566_EDAN012525 [Ephemera danica]|nr:hypothetical protein B566_EDAN012525 [Ephemera danica]